jgi:hypothetical protein
VALFAHVVCICVWLGKKEEKQKEPQAVAQATGQERVEEPPEAGDFDQLFFLWTPLCDALLLVTHSICAHSGVQWYFNVVFFFPGAGLGQFFAVLLKGKWLKPVPNGPGRMPGPLGAVFWSLSHMQD